MLSLLIWERVLINGRSPRSSNISAHGKSETNLPSKNYWGEHKDESTSEILQALESHKELRGQYQKDPSETLGLSYSNQKLSINQKSQPNGFSEKKPIIPETSINKNYNFNGMRGKAFIKGFGKIKVYTKNHIQHNSFKVFTNTYLENEYKLSSDQINISMDEKGVYPSCLIYLKKHNIFVSGSSATDKPHYLKFMRFCKDESKNQMKVEFMIKIRTRKPITRICCDSKDTFLILAFNNDVNCCLEVKKRTKKNKKCEKNTLNNECLYLENKNDILLTKDIESSKLNKDQMPVIKHMWTNTNGFYYKAIDFIKIDINRLIRNKYWKKNITKSGLKNLEKVINQYSKNGTF